MPFSSQWYRYGSRTKIKLTEKIFYVSSKLSIMKLIIQIMIYMDNPDNPYYYNDLWVKLTQITLPYLGMCLLM